MLGGTKRWKVASGDDSPRLLNEDDSPLTKRAGRYCLFAHSKDNILQKNIPCKNKFNKNVVVVFALWMMQPASRSYAFARNSVQRQLSRFVIGFFKIQPRGSQENSNFRNST